MKKNQKNKAWAIIAFIYLIVTPAVFFSRMAGRAIGYAEGVKARRTRRKNDKDRKQALA